jgi:hypothetical protein
MERTETVITTAYKPITVITEDDGGAVLYVLTDYRDGRGPVLSMSVPSGRLAGYPEARELGLMEARRKVAEKRAEIIRCFGGAAAESLI